VSDVLALLREIRRLYRGLVDRLIPRRALGRRERSYRNWGRSCGRKRGNGSL